MPSVVPFAHCEKQFFERLSQLGFAPSCVVDIGGSTGAWSMVIAEVFPDCAFELFEPLAGRRDDYDRALEWVLRNQPRFRLHPIALGAANGMAEFWNEPTGVGSSLLADSKPAREKIVVPVSRLDEYLAENAIPQPQIVKLDIQGGELMAMQGGPDTIAGADALHIETWLTRGYGKSTPLLPEIMDFLRPFGHRLVHLGDFWRRPNQELASVDAFFLHQRLIDRLASEGAAFPWPQNWTPEA